jgi:hypothetical protein
MVLSCRSSHLKGAQATCPMYIRVSARASFAFDLHGSRLSRPCFFGRVTTTAKTAAAVATTATATSRRRPLPRRTPGPPKPDPAQPTVGPAFCELRQGGDGPAVTLACWGSTDPAGRCQSGGLGPPAVLARPPGLHTGPAPRALSQSASKPPYFCAARRSAFSKSAIRSSTDSRPIESRMTSSPAPHALRCSGVNCERQTG